MRYQEWCFQLGFSQEAPGEERGEGAGKKRLRLGFLALAVLTDFEIVDKNVKAITALGLEMKDVNSGLVDFLAERDGREVYLCWRYNEPTVAHWHDLEAGFAGRRPLE